jgi:hypothetical protein
MFLRPIDEFEKEALILNRNKGLILTNGLLIRIKIKLLK